MKNTFTALLCLLLSGFSLHAESPRKWKAENVVIMVMDGARYSETWGEPTKAYIPKLAGPLAAKGCIYTNFFNKGPTLTNPGHTAISSGFYQNIDNTGKQLPKHPTLLQRLVKETQDESKAWLVATKDKLAVLMDCTDPEWKGKYRSMSWCGKDGQGLKSGYGDDPDTFETVQSVLKNQTPQFLLINFRQPDSAGHKKQWDQYLQGIRDGDAYAAQIVELLDSIPFYKNKTAFFMTNDHGRHLDGHKDGFVSHGDDCVGCRHILLYAYGPDFKQGEIIAEEAEQIDIAVTAASILGLDIPESKGRVLSELFRAEK
jgi:predicted AlkP superfamily pyrophosphatase or phosphodiesterase